MANKGDLITGVSAVVDMTKSDTEKVVNATLDYITGRLSAGEEVAITGFGKFEVRSTSARTGRNPTTGEEISIAAGKKPAFKAGKALKDAVG